MNQHYKIGIAVIILFLLALLMQECERRSKFKRSLTEGAWNGCLAAKGQPIKVNDDTVLCMWR